MDEGHRPNPEVNTHPELPYHVRERLFELRCCSTAQWVKDNEPYLYPFVVDVGFMDYLFREMRTRSLIQELCGYPMDKLTPEEATLDMLTRISQIQKDSSL